MKRYIRSNAIQQLAHNAAQARKKLETYSKEQIDLVRKCFNDVLEDINEYYDKEEAGYEAAIHTSEIKRDWLISAIEDDLMTEEEFEDIYNCLDIIGTESAHSVA